MKNVFVFTLLFAIAAAFAAAQTPEIPLSDTRIPVHTLLREDVFDGFLANNMARFERGEKNIDLLMEQRPGQKGNLLAWKGSTLLYRAVRAHEGKRDDEFQATYQKALDAFAQASATQAGNDGVAAITGGSFAVFAGRLPKEQRADAWKRAYDNYQMLWKQQGAVVDRLPLHLRGELLAGVALSAQRTGHQQESDQFVERILVALKDTPYEVAAKEWKKNSYSGSIACQSCHDEGRLAPRVAALKTVAMQQAAPSAAPPAARPQPPMPPGPNPNSQYRLGPDSFAQEGVPQGEIRGPFTLPSQVYPGTQHTYWVYVPQQYDPAVPAALMVFQDGQAFKDEAGDIRAHHVMDNLIYRREIPVMLGVFINPGRRPDQPEPTLSEWGDRTTNRPAEYNTPDDKYAKIITEELMPALQKDYNISKDPEQHGIGGSSSGAIAAFMVAWERPNVFRKVLSNVGSFVDLRGGYVYPERVLAGEKKPIRVFLCDGRNDNRGLGRDGAYNQNRDWFYQNVRLMKALTQKGYDVNYSWSMNLHGQKYGGMIMPEMMRWLWRDGLVSTDPNDMVERSFRQPAQKQAN